MLLGVELVYGGLLNDFVVVDVPSKREYQRVLGQSFVVSFVGQLVARFEGVHVRNNHALQELITLLHDGQEAKIELVRSDVFGVEECYSFLHILQDFLVSPVLLVREKSLQFPHIYFLDVLDNYQSGLSPVILVGQKLENQIEKQHFLVSFMEVTILVQLVSLK